MIPQPNAAYADHQAIAWKCQLEPGKEVLVDVYGTRQAAEAVARGVRSGKFRAYRPAGAYDAVACPAQYGTAVWARYVDGLDAEPVPETMTVRVPDYCTQPGYEGVTVVTVEISARCRACGGPRGKGRPDTFVRDGKRLVRDAWDNACGHHDSYTAVLHEARHRVEHPRKHKGELRGGELKGVEGGKYAAAVDLIASALEVNPWFSAQKAIALLNDNGEHQAAATVRDFAMSNVAGPSTSGKSAALFLVHLDTEARAADASTTMGDEK
ncbi:hypothetical protein GTY54_22350 [Streptomyces sp. SID625]|nr:hypothetical protein [Streptomyces sp. SID625]